MGPRYATAHRSPVRRGLATCGDTVAGMDPLRSPLHKRLRPAHWVVIDYAVTLLLAFVYVVVWKDLAKIDGPHWAVATIVAFCVLPAAVRRRWPRAVLVMVVAGQVVATTFGANPQPALAVAFAMYLIPLRFPRREALWWLAGTLLAMTAGLVAFGSRTHITALVRTATGVLLVSSLLITVVWMIGYSVRQQHAYTANLQEQAQRQAREELAEARRAISEQRLEIARELHDVVAHTMSVIAVQAGVAHYVIDDNPREAARALSSIERSSRGALHEMRALLGVLRTDDGSATSAAGHDSDLVPEPGLADLDGLVERTAHAGLRVDLDICGQRSPLSAGLDLAAYRVIQEAITNVIKHAATDRCRVTIAYQQDALTLEVTDNGFSHNDSGGQTTGHGIVGMRERVGMYGGEFHAAPLPGHGFRVTACFPLTESPV
jgi:signal transduction histidine kinase